uniref:Uncharacterized protein n=1 Tax=Rhizophora mucronata TaxID=61149 RepID=A0A2P2PW72_RHIMU
MVILFSSQVIYVKFIVTITVFN